MKALSYLALSAVVCLAACADGDSADVASTIDTIGDTSAPNDVPVVPTVCGDGRVEGTELCDEGYELNGTYAHCRADCGGAGAFCGDGTLDAGELCDDGADNGTWNHCSIACNGPGIRCGNGFIEAAFELCDDGDNNGRYGFCAHDCQGVSATCGDGVVAASTRSIVAARSARGSTTRAVVG